MADTKTRLAAFKDRDPRAGAINFADEITKTTQDGDHLNINAIISKYQKTGIIPVNTRQALYGDFSQVEDYLAAQKTYLRAQEQFEHLPSKLKAELHYDAAEFLGWITNPDNREQAIKLGLIEPKTAPAGATTARSEQQGGEQTNTGKPEK